MGLAEDLEVLAKGAGITPQNRGREFERWLKALLDLAGMRPRASFRPRGEEIDGSFVDGGRIYLLEAKWLAKPLPASTIYQFKGKIDGKLVGTVGVMVSMSGYSEDAVEALRRGKTLNVILFDGQDIRAAVADGFEAVLSFKIHAAVEFGEPYVPYVRAAIRTTPNRVIIVVEGERDAFVIGRIAGRLRRSHQGYDYQIITALGATGVPGVSMSLAAESECDVLVIIDAAAHRQAGWWPPEWDDSEHRVQLIVLDHGLIEWLSRPERYAAWHPDEVEHTSLSQLRHLVSNLNLDDLAERSESFRRFVAVLDANLWG
ncbi:restriction endonuclease [Frankia gtarii]|uniref:restriction endonuclease n=1 Tax=Frankia gtarii TaxID=2950102 RepID=UPI0021BEA0DB|nr:restriction endonuclease [Frankia gtarii]